MITRVNANEKALALTDDDGPSTPHTEKLLEILRKFDAKATFFVIGEHVKDNIETT